jgi:hypothetical protein
MSTAQKSAPAPPWKASLEVKTRRRIKAPFAVTRMNGSPKHPLFWLWSRRGASWIVERDLHFQGEPPNLIAALSEF